MAKDKRKPNGSGSIRRRPDGRYELRECIGTDMMGKAIRKSFYGDTATEARRAYKEWIKNRKEAPESVPIERVKKVGEWATHWLDIYKKDKVSYGTYRNYKLYVDKHIVPALGQLKLNEVRPAHIENLYRTKKGLSYAAQRDIHTAIRGIFETAVDNNLCLVNPALKVKPPAHTKTTPNVFTPSEIAKILHYAPEHPYGYYVELLLYTGLRRGELLALLWSDIDMEEGIIHVITPAPKYRTPPAVLLPPCHGLKP